MNKKHSAFPLKETKRTKKQEQIYISNHILNTNINNLYL